MEDTASTLDPALAARLAELEALVAAQRTALGEERAARAAAEAERDRLREAYEALTREVELARRRLVVAKAERVDTTQLELEFAAKLAELDKLSRKAEDEIGEKPERERKKKQPPRGRRDLRLLDLPEERVEITDPLLDGKAARIGTEDSIELRWKRGGFVRVVFARIKYDATRDVFRVLPHWPRDRYLELAPRYWRITRARLRSDELDREVGWLTIPEPLPTMPAINAVPATP